MRSTMSAIVASMLFMNVWRRCCDGEKEVADAPVMVPVSIRSTMPYGMTSVYATRSVNAPVSSPASSAFATLPTPD